VTVKYKGTYLRDLTRTLTEETATMTEFVGDRDKSKARLNTLRAKLDEGVFFAPRWAYVTVGGKRYRINGKHSAHVLDEANGHFPKDMKVVIDEWECDTDIDLAHLFAQYDNPISSRTATDVAGAHAKIHPELRGIKNTYIVKIMAGVSAHLNGIDTTRSVKAEDRANLVHDYPGYVHDFSSFKTPWIISRLGAAAAMFASWCANQSEAFTFWNLVSTESHPDTSHPTRVLAAWLKEISLAKSKPPHRETYTRCAHAWNAFRRGETTNLRYVKNGPLPTFSR
jgi:hypothetical protein